MSKTSRSKSHLFILLTHSREIGKRTNTGQLVLKQNPAIARRVIWERKKPDKELLALISTARVGILYPDIALHNGITSSLADIDELDYFILIDSTWQEARKIMNRSEYLHDLPRISLVGEHPSKFNLRRNQLEGGMCTAEAAINLLQKKGLSKTAIELKIDFENFIDAGYSL